MGKTKKNNGRRKADKILAREQHRAVIKFLNRKDSYLKLIDVIPQGRELVMLNMLLGSKRPVSSDSLTTRFGLVASAVSQISRRLSEYLEDFSRNYKILSDNHLIIEIPRRPTSQSHFGYFLACRDTQTGKYLSGTETTKLLFTPTFDWLSTAEKVLDKKRPPDPQWFRPHGLFYCDFESEKYYKRAEVDILKQVISDKTVFLLYGEASTAKTTIVRTLIYERPKKENNSNVYYFDIAPDRYFNLGVCRGT